LIEELADDISSYLRADRPLLVGIDGIDGAGKSTLGDKLAAVLRSRGIPVVRSTIDSFHRPRAERWRRGRWSPEGFYRDSHDLVAFRRLLLDPVLAGAAIAVTAAFDEPSDTPVAPDPVPLEPESVVLVDGIFLHRPQLADLWDRTIFVDGWDRVMAERVTMATAGCPPGGGEALVHLLGWWVVLSRYVQGQRLYLDECDPKSKADVVVRT
jgi:uridine kinase